jgi:hypothetical protein
MSIDRLVYSARESLIEAEPLREELARAGWAAAAPPTVVWIGGAREAQPTVLRDVLLRGWRPGTVDETRVRALIERLPLDVPGAKDSAHEQLERIGGIAACEIHGAPFVFEPGELETYPGLTPPLRARLETTRTQYFLRARATHVASNLEFLDAVCKSLAVLIAGAELDPTTGTWTDARA